MILPFTGVTLAMLAVMSAAWLYQRAAQNGGWTDVFWTYGTGATCALAALATIGSDGVTRWRPWLVAAMVLIWAVRLGSYVALRVARLPEDVRYARLRKSWGRRFQRNMFGLLIVQAPVTGILGMAVVCAAAHPAASFRFADALGVATLLAGILGETLADRQMARFRAEPANKGGICDTGLWAWSRHPNYLFEVLGWVAYPIIAFDRGNPWSLAALAAPLLIFLVVRFATGVPALETAMLASKGDAYRRYQNQVGAIFPRIPFHWK